MRRRTVLRSLALTPPAAPLQRSPYISDARQIDGGKPTARKRAAISRSRPRSRSSATSGTSSTRATSAGCRSRHPTRGGTTTRSRPGRVSTRQHPVEGGPDQRARVSAGRRPSRHVVRPGEGGRTQGVELGARRGRRLGHEAREQPQPRPQVAPPERWCTATGGAERYAFHQDTRLSGTRFWSWFEPNTIQTFEVSGLAP